MLNGVGPTIAVDLPRVRRNAEEIRKLVGVPVIAVVKSDGYGLGAGDVVRAIADVVDGFCVFGLAEVVRFRLGEITNKPILAIGPRGDASAEDFLAHGVTPAVYTVEQAREYRAARPALSIDTGMQRFACPPEEVAEALKAGEISQAFTHAARPDQAAKLVELAGGRGKLFLHAAGSSLLHEAACRLDAVRPGLALYRGAARVSARLVEARDGRGPAGYTGFECPRHGVILCGYSIGLRPGPCLINGRRSRVLEVGMQSAFVEAAPGDKVGDEVVLLGDGLEADEIGKAWKASAQEVLVSLLRSRWENPVSPQMQTDEHR
jgi:alanine racemase